MRASSSRASFRRYLTAATPSAAVTAHTQTIAPLVRNASAPGCRVGRGREIDPGEVEPENHHVEDGLGDDGFVAAPAAQNGQVEKRRGGGRRGRPCAPPQQERQRPRDRDEQPHADGEDEHVGPAGERGPRETAAADDDRDGDVAGHEPPHPARLALHPCPHVRHDGCARLPETDARSRVRRQLPSELLNSRRNMSRARVRRAPTLVSLMPSTSAISA